MTWFLLPKRTKEVPVGKVMRLESEGRLDPIWNLSPGSEVVDRVAVAELLYPVAGLDKLKLNVNFKSNVFKLLVIQIKPTSAMRSPGTVRTIRK